MRKSVITLLALAGLALATAARAEQPADPDGIVGCTTSDSTLCLNNKQFSVTATYSTPQGASGSGHAVSLTDDTGYFWFFSSSNVEFVIKALNGCGLNSHYWVFAGGLTNVRVDIFVTAEFGGTQHYVNHLNTAFQPLQDTNAFGCPISSARFKEDVHEMTGVSERLLQLRTTAASAASATSTGAGAADRLSKREVARVFPELVLPNAAGKPVLVRAAELPAMLLRLAQRQEEEARQRQREIDALKEQLARLERQLAKASPEPPR